MYSYVLLTHKLKISEIIRRRRHFFVKISKSDFWIHLDKIDKTENCVYVIENAFFYNNSHKIQIKVRSFNKNTQELVVKLIKKNLSNKKLITIFARQRSTHYQWIFMLSVLNFLMKLVGQNNLRLESHEGRGLRDRISGPLGGGGGRPYQRCQFSSKSHSILPRISREIQALRVGNTAAH